MNSGTKILLIAFFAQTTQFFMYGMEFLFLPQPCIQCNQKKQLKINKRDKDGWTLLHHAALDGDVELVKKLFRLGANVNAINNKGHSPLFFADNLEVVSLFLEHQLIDLNIQDIDGWTVLMYAVRDLRLEEKAKLLLTKLPALDLCAVSLKGHTALSIAQSKESDGLTSLASFLLDLISNPDNINKTNKINKHDEDGNTLLHNAAMDGNLDTIKIFLSLGANVNAINSKGKTPLFVARSPEVISVLLEQPFIDVNIQDYKGRTALVYTVRGMRDDNVERLLKHPDIDVCAKKLKSASALSTAILFTEYEPLILSLLEHINEFDELLGTWKLLHKKYDHGPCLDLHRERIKKFLDPYDTHDENCCEIS